MSENYLNRAIDTVQKAINEDNAGHTESAFSLYVKALEYFELVRKYEKNPAVIAKITPKIQQYMKRAEELSPTPVQAEAAAAPETFSKMDSRFMTVTWNDVAGLEDAKNALKEAVIMPRLFPNLFIDKLTPWKGILLYGPPGTGKTHLARAAATEAKSSFYSISSADIVTKWLGDSEKRVRSLFEDARNSRPSIIFIDEVDSLCSKRSGEEGDKNVGLKNELLKQLDGIDADNNGILVLGATNLPWVLDSAMIRRFERRIYIPLPCAEARCTIFKLCAGNTLCNLTKREYEELADATDGYNGSDIAIITRDALMQRVRKVQTATHFKRTSNDKWTPCSPGDLDAVAMDWSQVGPNELEPPSVTITDFRMALLTTKSSVQLQDLKKFENWK
jgi:vacuolar protein-sorting-associated protein 4